MIELITTWIEQNLSVSADAQTKIFFSLVVIIVLLILRALANRVLSRRIEDTASLYRWRKSTGYLFLGISITLIGFIWLRGTGSVVTYLGLVSAALVIALQDPISDFVGWVFIISRRPFEIEDRIQIGEDAGDVIDIRFFQFSLNEIRNWVDADQSTGRVLHVPNRKVFSHNIANYTKGFSFLWNEIPVVLTFESDWRKGKALLQEIAERHTAKLSNSARERAYKESNRYLIYYKNLTPIVYTKVVDHGITLTIRYLCTPRRRRGSEEAVWEDILDLFAKEPTLEFAYPTQRIYYHPVEGPPELKRKPEQDSGIKLDDQ
jgi:small-conductance mechanosensitive channel